MQVSQKMLEMDFNTKTNTPKNAAAFKWFES